MPLQGILRGGQRLLVGGRFVLPDRVIEGGALLVSEGRVVAVYEAASELPRLPREELGGAWVTPGLVELHIHGAGGIGFDDLGDSPAEAAKALRRTQDFLRSRGVTSFVPTLVYRERELAALAAAIGEAAFPRPELPGIYLEGPFVAASHCGGIPADTLHEYSPEALSRVLSLGGGRIVLMTYAPEKSGARELAKGLANSGIIPCLGHSDADLDRVALPEGSFSITHLFNAMSPFSHKKAGLAMLPFVDGRPFVELNADGVHVGATALRACFGAVDPDRLVLISDAVVAAGLPHGDYNYYGMPIVSGDEGVRYADSRVLMGSNRLAPDVLRHWLAVTGAPVHEALRALTMNPARLLGFEAIRGAIVPGMQADLVVWEGDFEGVREIVE